MTIIEEKGNTTLGNIYFIYGGKRIKPQYFTYAQSKSVDGGDTGWLPIAAETVNDVVTMVIRYQTTHHPFPHDLVHQAIDYNASTGELIGLHGQNGTYLKFNKADPNWAKIDTSLYYFNADRLNEFLTRFAYVLGAS